MQFKEVRTKTYSVVPKKWDYFLSTPQGIFYSINNEKELEKLRDLQENEIIWDYLSPIFRFFE